MAINRKRRPPRGGRGGRGRRGGRRHGLSLPVKFALAAIPLAGIIGGGWFGMNHFMSIEKIDTVFCYERDDQHQTAVFIDASLNGLTAPILRDYRTALMEAFENAPANGRVMIFTTDKAVQQTTVRPVAEICRPARKATEQAALKAPEMNAPMLSRNFSKARETWTEKVDEVLTAVHDDKRHSGDSPILEQLREISHYPGFQSRSRSLVWISDGIQNSREGRFCSVKGQMPSHTAFAKRPEYGDIKPNPFTGSSVSVLLVEHQALGHGGLRYCTQNEMRKWWVDYFTANGADNVRLTPLRHWAGS